MNFGTQKNWNLVFLNIYLNIWDSELCIILYISFMFSVWLSLYKLNTHNLNRIIKMVFFLIMYSQYLYEKVTKLTCNLMVLKYACNYKDQI